MVSSGNLQYRVVETQLVPFELPELQDFLTEKTVAALLINHRNIWVFFGLVFYLLLQKGTLIMLIAGDQALCGPRFQIGQSKK